MKKVFAIAGKMRSGKNQLAEYMAEEYKKRGKTVSFELFARGVKDGCKEDFKELKSYLSNKADRINEIVRQMTNSMQSYVTNWGLDLSGMNSYITQFQKEVSDLKFTDEHFEETKTDITRRLLQIYGTEIFRKRVDKDYWIKETINRINKTVADIIFITDCRFPNEIEGLYSVNMENTYLYEFVPIRVTKKIDRKDVVNQHESENSLDDYKEFIFEVENDGTLIDLKNSAIEIINHCEKGE